MVLDVLIMSGCDGEGNLWYSYVMEKFAKKSKESGEILTKILVKKWRDHDPTAIPVPSPCPGQSKLLTYDLHSE